MLWQNTTLNNNESYKYVGDPRFIEILNKFIKAGYINTKTGKLVHSYIGTPQGLILSTLQANIVLHELDKYMFKYETSWKKGLKRIINRNINL